MDKIRWGVLAPGRIARSFAADLALVPDTEITAVGSRRIDAARATLETERAERLAEVNTRIGEKRAAAAAEAQAPPSDAQAPLPDVRPAA